MEKNTDWENPDNATKLKRAPKLPKDVVKDGAKWLMMPSKIVLDGVSVWPERQNNITLVLHFLCVTSHLLLSVGHYFAITDKNADIGAIVGSISLFIISVETTTRRVLCYFYREKLRRILSNVYFDFWPSNMLGNDLHKELTKDSWYLFIFVFTYSFTACSGIVQHILEPIFYRMLPLGTAYPFAWKESPYYELMYVWHSFLIGEVTFNTCGLDLFFVSLLSNCVAQFKLLKVFLIKSFDEIIQNAVDDPDRNKAEMEKSIRLCIEHHNKLIRTCKEIDEAFTYFILVLFLTGMATVTCKEIDEAFTYFILVLFLTGMATVCVSAFIATAIPEKLDTAFTYLMGHLCEIFIYCYMGNELIVESEALSNAAFECGWHLSHADRDLEKSLIMIMARSQKPIYMTAAGFGFLSLPSFLKLMQFSFSVYTLLNTLMDKE